jgi:hypothetical protein
MLQALRNQFNANFTTEKYERYVQQIENISPGNLDFRNAETPIFVDKAFTQQMLAACESIIDVIVHPDFLSKTERSIPKNLNVANENSKPEFIAFDFGICQNSKNELEPQLIEMQAFPTLFAFQRELTTITAKYANVPENFSSYLNNFTQAEHDALLKQLILSNHAPENVILLEIFPKQQKTRIDFFSTEALVGIKTVCLTELIAEDNKLYYLLDNKKTQIHRIYNRLIFDDLNKQENLPPVIDLTQPFEVEWAPHPNWFYRISKFTLPFLTHKNIPTTYFLNELQHYPTDLENYVLKPLFSFAGMGVVIDVTLKDIEAIEDPENWILQKKVQYADVIVTPDEPAKAEIRLFYFWPPNADRPIAVHNLARLSKGKMVGTRYNKDKTWVGGSIAYFEK